MRILTTVAVLLGITSIAYGQTQPGSIRPPGGTGTDPGPAPTVPAAVLYRLYFQHLETLDAFAARLEAAGREGGAWRTHEQQAVGLSEEDGASLKQVAHDCLQAVRAVDARAKDVATSFRAANPNGAFRTLPPPPELAELQDEQTATLSGCMDRLRTALGEDTFQHLDSYIQTRFGASVTQTTENPGPRAALRKRVGGAR